MKTLLGYVLSEKQTSSILDTISETFGTDPEQRRIIHPEFKPDRRHVDVAAGTSEKGEGCFVTFGCSARKLRRKKTSNANWFSPCVEAFLKTKASFDDLSEKDQHLYSSTLRCTCVNSFDSPENELIYLNGFEYLFFDNDKEYHDITGYWGVFVVPRFKKEVDGLGEVLFYQLIPAYKHELDYVEQNAFQITYQELIEAIVEHIPDRQYFDVRCEELSEDEMDEIRINRINKKNGFF